MQFTAKSVAEATANGLKELGLTEENAVITVIEEPAKGLFGKVKGQAVVDIYEKEVVKKESKEEFTSSGKEQEFIKELLKYLDIDATVTKTIEGEKEILSLATESQSDLIGYRGEVLDAIQTLAGAVANIGQKDYKKVVVDCENYRERREDTLVKLAHKLEEKATEMKREVHLEPMNPYERRIIHTALIDSKTVTTTSDGKEPNRFVIIIPNEKDEYSKPYLANLNHAKSQHGKKPHGGKPMGKGGKNFSAKKSGFAEAKRKTSSGFGTYLGNSMKDNF